MQLTPFHGVKSVHSKVFTNGAAASWAARYPSAANAVLSSHFEHGPRQRERSQQQAILPQDVSSRFGGRLRKLRQERYMTQSEMAKKFGIDRSFISDVERGRKSISLHTLEVIAIGMGISLSKLFENI